MLIEYCEDGWTGNHGRYNARNEHEFDHFNLSIHIWNGTQINAELNFE
jgi:hypothetical protein